MRETDHSTPSYRGVKKGFAGNFIEKGPFHLIWKTYYKLLIWNLGHIIRNIRNNQKIYIDC